MYWRDFLNYYAEHYLQYENLTINIFNVQIEFVKSSVLLNRTNKTIRIQQTNANTKKTIFANFHYDKYKRQFF